MSTAEIGVDLDRAARVVSELLAQARDMDVDAAVVGGKAAAESFFHKLIQSPCILADKDWLQAMDEDRAKHADGIVGNGDPFRTIFGSYAT